MLLRYINKKKIQNEIKFLTQLKNEVSQRKEEKLLDDKTCKKIYCLIIIKQIEILKMCLTN